MADLASLVVKLEAETSQYTAAIQKATEQMGGFADTVGSSIADVAKNLLALEALKHVFDFTEKIVNTVANFEVLSHALGGTTEQLSQLSFAAKLFNVEDISFAFERLARSVGAVETGNQKTIDVFKALGVSIYDTSGRLKTTEQQLLDVSDAVAKYNDGLSKTSAVQQIFGRSGADFIAFLDQGSKKIKEAQQEAIDLGVSISSPAAKAAHEFQEDMTRIKAAFQGVFYRALEELLPVFKEITEQIIAFAKNADNTKNVVDELVAGFKVIGTVLVFVGTVFEALGQTIGAFAFSAVTQIKAVAEFFTNVWQNPLDAAKNFVIAQDQILGTFKDAAVDVFKMIGAGGNAIESIWDTKPINAWGLALDDAWDDVKKKPDLQLINEKELKTIEKAIEALAAFDDKLKQQVATYGLSGAAATIYDITLGKLSADVDELNKKSLKETQGALAALEKQGKLSQVQIEQINAAIAAGIPLGDAFKRVIIDDALALDRLKGIDALTKLDAQLLTMTGHLQEAGQAAFDLANRPLRITIQTQQDKTTFSGLDSSQRAIEVTSQLNALRQQAIAIEDALGKKIVDVDASVITAGASNLQIAGEEAVARQGAIAQLEALFVRAQALANATGLKPAVDEAKALRDAIGAIQFNPKIVQDVEAATLAQKRLNEAILAEKNANDDLSIQLADLNKQRSEGSVTDLEFMAKQDDARQASIDQLTKIRDIEAQVLAENPGNAQALDSYKKLGVQITNLQSQMGELARTIRTDLTDSLSKAFVDFADGSKSAGAALKSFVLDFNKQLLDLASKQLFQKLFETTGINKGIDTFFSVPSKAAGGLAGATTAATTISTAMTTAATTGSTALGAGITTGATTGATALGTALETSGTTAATLMGTAIETAGSTAAAAMGAAIAAAGASSAATSAAVQGFAGAALGGPVPAGQLTLVGEKGPELFVSDLGETTAATATRAGTRIPDDTTYARVIGAAGPEYIRPDVSGFVIPNDTFIQRLGERAASQATALTPSDSVFRDVATAAGGGPVYGGQTVRIGEQGPELLVSNSGGATASSVTRNGTQVPRDFGSSQLVGVGGPAYIRPTVDGYVVPADVLAAQVPARHLVGGASVFPNVDSYTISVNGIKRPIGFSETFTVDAQGRTSFNEHVKTYVGMALPAGTVTASGGKTITASDIVYPPRGVSPDQFIGIYAPGELKQQQLNVTLASYAKEFGSPPPPETPAPVPGPDSRPVPGDRQPHLNQLRIPAFVDGGHFAAGPILVGERGPEILVPGGHGTVIPNSAVQGAALATPARVTTLNTEPIVAAFDKGSTKTATSITSAFNTGAAMSVSTSALTPAIGEKFTSSLAATFASGALLFSNLFRSDSDKAGVGAKADGESDTASLNTDAVARAAGGGPVPAGQLTLVGEKGPELFVSDLGETTAATATRAGTQIPGDLTHARVIGVDGPEYIKSNASGFVVPSDTFLRKLSDRTAPQVPQPDRAVPDFRAGRGAPDGERLRVSDGRLPAVPGSPSIPASPATVGATQIQSPAPALTPSIPAFLPVAQASRTETPPAPVGALPSQILTLPSQALTLSAPVEALPSQALPLVAQASRAEALPAPVETPSTPALPSQVLTPLAPAQTPSIPALPPVTQASRIEAPLAPAQTPSIPALPPQALTPPAPVEALSILALPSQALTPPAPVEAPSNLALPSLAPAQTPSIPALPLVAQAPAFPATRAEPASTETPAFSSTVQATNVVAFPVPQQQRVPNSDGITTPVTELQADVIAFPTPSLLAAPAAPQPTQANVSSTNVIAFQVPSPPVTPAVRQPVPAEVSSPTNVIAFPTPPPLPVTPTVQPVSAVASPTNVIAFPAASEQHTFATTKLDVAFALPSAPDRSDAEVTRVYAPERQVQLDQSTSAMIVKFEKVVRHEQSRDVLDAHEYEALLTDRYLQKRVSGGPVSAGTPYLVGEGGPELMVPDSSGTVMNSWDDSHSNNRSTIVHQTNHFHISSPTGKVDRASQGQIAARTALSVQFASGKNN